MRTPENRSQRQRQDGKTVTGFYTLLQAAGVLSQDCATRRQKSTNEKPVAALNL
jgi:hypothetical protein